LEPLLRQKDGDERMLSDETTAMLSFLRTLPAGAACDACLAAYLGVHRDKVRGASGS